MALRRPYAVAVDQDINGRYTFLSQNSDHATTDTFAEAIRFATVEEVTSFITERTEQIERLGGSAHNMFPVERVVTSHIEEVNLDNEDQTGHEDEESEHQKFAKSFGDQSFKVGPVDFTILGDLDAEVTKRLKGFAENVAKQDWSKAGTNYSPKQSLTTTIFGALSDVLDTLSTSTKESKESDSDNPFAGIDELIKEFHRMNKDR